MAITLRPNEVVKVEVQFHWSAFIVAKMWAGLGLLSLLGQAMAAVIGTHERHEDFSPVPVMLVTIVMFGLPLLYKWLQNKNKVYVVTNQRVYVEEGILSKSKRDIPLSKVNDMAVTQGLFQRMFGSGNVKILTGNDKPTVIKDVERPDDFKAAISEVAGHHARPA